MAIFFAAFLILFSILYSTINDAFDSVTDSFDERYDEMSDRIQTDINIVSSAYYRDSNMLEIVIYNDGSKTLDLNKISLLVNGTLVPSATIEVEGVATDYLLPMEEATISVSDPELRFDSDVDSRTKVSTTTRLAAPTNVSVGQKVYILDGTSIDVFSLDGLFDFTITDPVNMVSPRDLCVYGNYLYVLDEGEHVDRFDLNGTWQDEFVNDSTNAPDPTAIAVDSNCIYLVDGASHVDRFNRSTGAFVDVLVANGGTMTAPVDVSVGAYLFVLDTSVGSYHIDRYNLDGTGGAQVVGSSYLATPTDITATSSGLSARHIYVVNNSEEIIVFDEAGTLVGSVSECLSDSVYGVDVTGRLFVSDDANGLIIEKLGTNIKVVVENGISEVTTL